MYDWSSIHRTPLSLNLSFSEASIGINSQSGSNQCWPLYKPTSSFSRWANMSQVSWFVFLRRRESTHQSSPTRTARVVEKGRHKGYQDKSYMYKVFTNQSTNTTPSYWCQPLEDRKTEFERQTTTNISRVSSRNPIQLQVEASTRDTRWNFIFSSVTLLLGGCCLCA